MPLGTEVGLCAGHIVLDVLYKSTFYLLTYLFFQLQFHFLPRDAAILAQSWES